MIRLLISVAFALVVATSAEAMSPAPLHEPDGMITQIRKAREREDPNQGGINGICEFDARRRPQPSTSVWHGMTAFAFEHYGTLKGWRARR